jgi:GntR family transcriptional regulator
MPLYYQVKQSLLDDIRSGEIACGDRLPGEKQLEEMFGVSQITVRRALSELASEGYVRRQPGLGTFVLPPKLVHRSGHMTGFLDDLAAAGVAIESRVLRFEMRTNPHVAVEKLGLDGSEFLLFIKRLILSDDEPLWLTKGYYHFGPEVKLTREDVENASVFRVATQEFGVVLSRADRTIEATLPFDEEAQLLGVSRTTPMLLVELTAYDDRANPVAFLKALYRGDRYKYHHTIPGFGAL